MPVGTYRAGTAEHAHGNEQRLIDFIGSQESGMKHVAADHAGGCDGYDGCQSGTADKAGKPRRIRRKRLDDGGSEKALRKGVVWKEENCI